MTAAPRHVIPIAQLRTYASAYLENDDWDAMLDFFRKYPTDWATIQTLVKELEHAPFFREPIYVGRGEEDDGFDGWVWDGTHRACAYILAGVQEVEVVFAEEDTTLREAALVSVETLISRHDGGNFPGGDYTERLWQVLMSLRLDDEHWITSDMNVGHPDGELLTIAWSDDAIGIPVAYIDEAIWVKLARAGIDVQELKISTGVYFND